MIHRLSVLDRNKSIGCTLFDDKSMYLQSDLLTSLVQALMMLSKEMGPVKGDLREAELGKYQISILSRDHLSYVVVHDTYDSEPFTKKILETVISKYHPTFKDANFNRELPDESQIKIEVARLLTTMKFPDDKFDEVEQLLDEFIAKIEADLDTLFLSDLDDGIINIHQIDPEDNQIIKLLMEILSEIPFERHWIGQSKLREPRQIGTMTYTNEIWLIYRIGQTDFCIMGRAYYNTMMEYDNLILELDNLVDQLADIVAVK